jgi:hypothetical protein
MSTTETYSPGELVHARGREWIVLGVGEALRLRRPKACTSAANPVS